MKLLKKGSKGPEVTDLQEMLVKVKAKPTLTPDGAFGSRTLEAVRDFQERKNLTVDGLVGDETMKALKKASGGPSGGSGAGDPALQKDFAAAYDELRKGLKANGHLMFLTLESLKLDPASCERIGTPHFTDMIPRLKTMLQRGAAVAKKNSGLSARLEDDRKLFEKELVSDPDKARKRFLVVKNQAKQVDELASEFRTVTAGSAELHEEIAKELRKRRTAEPATGAA